MNKAHYANFIATEFSEEAAGIFIIHPCDTLQSKEVEFNNYILDYVSIFVIYQVHGPRTRVSIRCHLFLIATNSKVRNTQRAGLIIYTYNTRLYSNICNLCRSRYTSLIILATEERERASFSTGVA